LEALMLDNIEKCWNDDPSFRSALKEAFDSVRSWKTAAAALKKCPQPKDFRWGSICAVFDWLNRWRPLFEIACLEIWTFGKAGTFHELIGEWLNWNQSEKVRAQYLLANEYVTKFWKHWWLEVCNETPMGHSSDFGAFWMLSLYLERRDTIQGMTGELECSDAYTAFVEAFGEESAKQALNAISVTAQECHEKYFSMAYSGVHALGALGSGSRSIVAAVTGALLIALEHDEAPAQPNDAMDMIAQGILDDHVEELLDIDGFLEGILQLRDECHSRENVDDFANWLLSRDNDNICVHWLRREVLPSPIHTQSVESVFAAVDYVMKSHNLGGKLKPSEKQGCINAPDLLDALLKTRARFLEKRSQATQEYFDALNDGGEKVYFTTPTVSHAKSVAAESAIQFLSLSPDDDVLGRAKSNAQKRRDQYHKPRGKSSSAAKAGVAKSLEQRKTKQKPRNATALFAKEVEVTHSSVCFDDEEGKCPSRRRGKRNLKMVQCTGCLRFFHLACLQDQRLLPKTKYKKEEVLCGAAGECYKAPLVVPEKKKRK